MTSTATASEPHDFSVVGGGPLDEVYRLTRLGGTTVELAGRRAVVVALVAWLPLLLLSMAEGRLWSGARPPFLLDVDVYARLLIALPLLILAEITVHDHVRKAVRAFVDRDLVPPEARPRFDEAIEAVVRLRNSARAEMLLLLFVYLVGVTVIWRGVVALDVETWYRRADGQFTLAGWWYFLVSLPMFQFLLFRWYYRLILWAWFLWRVARNPLNLRATHPDHCGGMEFLGLSMYGLVPLLFAHGVLFAGVAATGILFEGRELAAYMPALIVAMAVVVLVALAPMLVFVPVLFHTKHEAYDEYGALGQSAAFEFDRQRARYGSLREVLWGDVDVRALSHLTYVHQTISSMRLVVVKRSTMLVLAAVTALPLLPLGLTVYSPGEVARLLWGLVF